MMTPQPVDPLSATFAALADPTRRAILARLSHGETSVTELARPFAMSGPAVSKHLKVLEKAGPAGAGGAEGGHRLARRLSAALGAELRPARRLSGRIAEEGGLTWPTKRRPWVRATK
jgi:hypothetical protein